MAFDIPIVLGSIYLFLTLNFFGWGMLHDQRFIFFSLVISFLYVVMGLFTHTRSEKLVIVGKSIILLVFIAVSVFVVSHNLIRLRHQTAVEGFINDSGLQAEIAGRFLLLGKNPYVETYENTDLAKAPYTDEAGNTINPALYHNAYPPFFLILSAIGFRVMSQAFSLFDIRMVYLVFYAALLMFGWVKFGLTQRFILFLALVSLNSIFVSWMLQGSNDVVVLTMLFWTLLLAERKHFAWAGVLMGLAIATKQIAWFALPFYLIYVWKTAPRQQRNYFFVAASSIALVLFVPFITWDAKALFESLVLYVNGSLPNSYPIHNFGLGIFLVKTWVIPTIYSYYPFWIWQVVLGGFVCILWWRYRGKQMTPADVLSGFTVLLATTWIFNRFMNFNYLGTLGALTGLTALWSQKRFFTRSPENKNT